MKKFILGFAALATLATVSCKKSDDGGGTSNTFTIAGSSYTSVTTVWSGGILAATDGNASNQHTVGIYFNGSTTPVAGTYKVVSGSPGANQIMISCSNGSSTAYASTGNDNVSATVSIDNGKVHVNMPNAWVKSVLASDSVQVSTNITQTN